MAATHATSALYTTVPLRASWVTAVAGVLAVTVTMALVGFLRDREAATETQVRLRTAELLEREQNLAITLDSIGDAVIATDTQGRVTRMNPVAEHLTGWPLALAAGHSLSEVFRIVENDTDTVLEDPVSKVLRSGAVVTLANNTTLKARDGAAYQIADSAAPIRDVDGRIVGTVLAFHDVTERRLAEKTTLRQLEELTVLHGIATACAQAADEDTLIRDVTRLIGDALYTADFGLLLADGAGVLYPHASYHQRVGRPTAAIQPGQGVVGQVLAERTSRRVDDAQLESNFINDSPVTRSELAVPVKVGERVIAVINAESPELGRFSAEDERLLGTIAGQLATAIERLRLEAQTRRRLAEVEALHSTSQEIIAAANDPERVYATVHHVAASLMPAEAFVIVMRDPERGDNEVVYAVDRGGRAPIQRVPVGQGLSGYVISRGEAVLMDDLNPRSDIEVVHFGSPESVRSFLAVPLRVNDQVIGVLSAQSYRAAAYTSHDLVLLETLANHLAAALLNIRLLRQTREQVQRVQAILDSVPEGVLLLDAEGHVLLANPVAAKQLDTVAVVDRDATLAALGGRPLAELLTSPPEGLWHEIRIDERTFEVTPRPVSQGPEPESYVLVMTDVTHARQVRTELERQERLAAVGQLAAGIAHDFNNILAVIVLYAQMGLRDRALPDQFRTYIQTISEQAHHAASLVQQILDFGRRAMLDPQLIDLVAFVRAQAALLARTLPESIRIETAFGADEITISADTTRFQQMITNLAVNARDAMPDGGVLHIGATPVRFEGHRSPLPEMAPGTWVRLTVSDTGTGMTPDVRAHVFEPFFTTKDPGKGTG
ncbi:MAG: GAF domain-containing protein, partial [Anaerolineae bacterium]